ncbi:MAG: response regulator transcription factor [Planctomycetes bacterium]|nr:response regulator transcription factor [Planctomycetota bacterium]
MNPRVLLVEPDPVDRKSFLDSVAGTEYLVPEMLSQPEEALRRYSPREFHVVVVPLLGKSAVGAPAPVIEVIRKLRGLAPPARVVVSYDDAHKILLAEAMSAGALGQIKKPFTKGVVRTALTNVFRRKSATELLRRETFQLRRPILVTYRLATDGFLKKSRSVTADNLGTTGLTLRTSEAIGAQTTLRLEIGLPHTTAAVKAVGIATRVHFISDVKQHEVVVQFTEIGESEREAIKHVIMAEMDQKKRGGGGGDRVL